MEPVRLLQGASSQLSQVPTLHTSAQISPNRHAALVVCLQAIKLVNERYLDRLGCIGVYSEYRNGMKAMAVYTKEAWEAKPK